MKKYFISVISGFITVLLLFSNLYSQVVYEPITNDIYNFLNRMSVKGIITYHDEIKPLSRKYIAEKLVVINKSISKLSLLENEQMEYYDEVYAEEIRIIKKQKPLKPETHFFEFGNKGTFKFFNYKDSLFTITGDPILGASFSSLSSKSAYHQWNGFRVFGYLGDYLGFNTDFRDNLEKGDNIDRTKMFTDTTGVQVVKSSSNSIQYSEVRASISTNWSWGAFTLAKDFLNIGSGIDGQLILSSKAPSFPFIRLDIRPAKWLSFTYIHAFLNSGLIDSSTIRRSSVDIPSSKYTYSSRPKYLVSHILSIYPTDNLAVSLGESMIYADRIEPIYLIPIIFFRPSDHFLSKAYSSGNTQWFANMYYKYLPLRTKFYGTLFIDELSLDALFTPNKGEAAIGYTVGADVIDPVIPNSEFVLEYTRVNPFVYMDFDPIMTYTSSGYQMGDWIGSNGDDFFTSYRQNILIGLNGLVFFRYVRKGQKELPDQQYTFPYPSFLYGLRTDYTYLGFTVRYQFIQNLTAQLQYQHESVSQQLVNGSASSAYNDLSFSLYYGL